MGRPLRKDVNGVDVIRTFGSNASGDTNAGIKLNGYFADDSGLNSDYMIIKQRGRKTFVVLSQAQDEFSDGDSISSLDSSKFRTGSLVSGTPAAEGELQMIGYTDQGDDSSAVAIAKITKRIAVDFSGNRYKWQMSNYEDSAGDVIVLTAI